MKHFLFFYFFSGKGKSNVFLVWGTDGGERNRWHVEVWGERMKKGGAGVILGKAQGAFSNMAGRQGTRTVRSATWGCRREADKGLRVAWSLFHDIQLALLTNTPAKSNHSSQFLSLKPSAATNHCFEKQFC